jgi:hypothetical protein
LAPSFTLPPFSIAGDYVHFLIDYPTYGPKVAAALQDGTHYVDFPWGGTGFVGTVQSDIHLVYDQRDEIAAIYREGQVSQRFGMRPCRDATVVDGPTRGECFQLRHMFGHFYRVQCWYNL